jgi:hypothetical protein
MQNDDIKSLHIAVYALSLLGGAHQKVHTEDIAQKCLEIAPDRFKWEKYNYPEKELVRKALFHASEARNGAFVTGRTGMEQRGKSRDGWQLTPAGAAWVRENEALFRVKGQHEPKSEAIPKREAERLLKKLRDDAAYQTFERTGDAASITRYMFTDLLNCSPDASPETIQAKFRRLLSNAELIGDEEMLRFLRLCKQQFSTLMAAPGSLGAFQ